MSLTSKCSNIHIHKHMGKTPSIDRSVFPLHYSGADMRASDYSDMNPFMLAVEKNHLEVVKAMIKKDPGLVSLSMGCGSTAIHWALEEGYNRSAFFKVTLSHPNFVNSFLYTKLLSGSKLSFQHLVLFIVCSIIV